MLINKVPPHNICTKIGLCDSSVSPIVQKVIDIVRESQLCTACEFVIQLLIGYLSTNEDYAIHEVEAFLHAIPCGWIPGFENECDTIVDTYTPEIIDYLINNTSPHGFCHYVSICEQ